MCQTCGEHFGKHLWYLDPEKHHIHSNGLLKDIIDQNMLSIILVAYGLVKKKQPYGTDTFHGLSQRLLNWFTKTIHGMQVLPDLDSAFRTIDMAEEVALIPCPCRHALNPELPPGWHCIGLNMTARIRYQKNSSYPVRVISKQEAKDITAARREGGAMQMAGWQWDASVQWLCNCDQCCGSHRVPEITWGAVPSFLASKLAHPEACDGCRECERWCLRPSALTYGEDGRPVIDEVLCRGCGQCIEHCPQNALGFATRQVYYDPGTKTIRDLGKEIVRV